MSIDQKVYIYKREMEIKQKRRIIDMLDIAECINMAYVGSQASNSSYNPNARGYEAWRQRKYKEIDPRIDKLTIWDRLKGSRRV